MKEGTTSSTTIRVAVVLIGLLLLAVVLLTPVKGWLNRIPYLWQVLFPLLTLLAGVALIGEIRARGSWLSLAKWALLLASAASASITFLLDGPRLFFTLGRWGAIAFIIVEVTHSLVESLAGEGGGEAA
jgi:Ni,Fe-hydrogenase I cytochrome b subunit